MKRREFSLAAAAAASASAFSFVATPALAQAAFKEGKDYAKLSKPVATTAGAGKVEVIEFFWYSCPHCHAFEPAFAAWKSAAPAVSGGPGTAPATPAARPDAAPAASADPLGDLARARAAGAEPFLYFVQAGAFRTPEDAESQRAKLSLMGVEAKVTERDQSGRTVYRVRTGPFDRKDDADRMKERLETGGLEAALVRVQR